MLVVEDMAEWVLGEPVALRHARRGLPALRGDGPTSRASASAVSRGRRSSRNGVDYEELAKLFPWADLEVDVQRFREEAYAEFVNEYGIWGSEDGEYILMENFDDWVKRRLASCLPALLRGGQRRGRALAARAEAHWHRSDEFSTRERSLLS